MEDSQAASAGAPLAVAASSPHASAYSGLTWSGSEIPSLYGYRGLAAVIVVIGHAAIWTGLPPSRWTVIAGSAATYAVIAFFVLSGFLITHLLLREQDKTDEVSLRRFYLRRAMRIFPAFYGYAACYILARLLFRGATDWSAVIACLTYTGDYYPAISGHGWETMAQTWSLAIEEQFYLLWPFILARWGQNRTSLMRGLTAAIAIVWAWRWIAVAARFNPDYVYSAFDTRADALAIGCLLAVASRQCAIPRWLIERKWWGALAVSVICICIGYRSEAGERQYGWILMALASALILIQSIAHCDTPWYRWLNSRPLHAMGIISYSLYLYHPFALRLPERFRTLSLELAVAIALATASYWIVERPFLRLKHRLAVSRPHLPQPAPEVGGTIQAEAASI